MNGEDKFERLIKSYERELRDLKTISARPFGLIKFYTWSHTTANIKRFTITITFDSEARLPAMMTYIQGSPSGYYGAKQYRTINTTAGTYTYTKSFSMSSQTVYNIRIDSSSPFTATIVEEAN